MRVGGGSGQTGPSKEAWCALLALVLGAFLPVTAQRTTKGKATYAQVQEDTGLAGLPGTDPAATHKYLVGLTFVPHAIVNRVNCHKGQTTRIAIWPEFRSNVLNPEHVQTRGRIVARIKNLGRTECPDLRLAPGRQAYWWMGPDSGGRFMTEFWRINRDGTAKRLALGIAHFNKDRQYARPAAYIGVPIKHTPPGREMELKLFGHNSTWIACLGGCCEAVSIDADAADK